MSENLKKVLIIGKNAYLAEGIEFDETKYTVDKIKRPLECAFEKYYEYDYIVNFCIQPEHFSRLLPEDEMIDVQIAKYLKGNTKFIFLSSRKVYGSTSELKEYKETDSLKPFDFYSKNKANIERKLQTILGDQLLILRTGNIIGLPPKRNCATFVSWLQSELKNNRKVVVTINKEAKKDFISKDYFQYALKKVIDNDLSGIYNLGAGFAFTIEELMKNLVDENLLEFNPQEEESEQFILNCEKINKYIEKYSKENFLEDCSIIKKYMCNLKAG